MKWRGPVAGVWLWLVIVIATTGGNDTIPPTPDRRPDPELIRVPDAVTALRFADARMIAELAVAEDPLAITAVAWVVRNRARACGGSLLEVVAARGQFGTRRAGRWVASWPKPARWIRAHAVAVERAASRTLAALAAFGGDPTGGATHFHRVGTWVPPYAPNPRRWRRFGTHAFYCPNDPNCARRPKCEM